LLTVFPGCIGLESAIGITIESRLSRVCSNSSADIGYRGVSGRHETCPIQKVEAVPSEADARRIAELRSESAKSR
jgi:hypothetical protein